MALPAGALLVGAVGAIIIVIALSMAYYGLAENFRDTLSAEGETGPSGRTYRALGTVGYVSKAVAIALVGGLFGYAAVTHDPQKSGGLDQALREVLHEPFGVPALLVVALGLACFGLFCFAAARHLDR
jgi:ABC-type Fe3+ transport system permease subunit